jgi:Tfp pilus assembly protein PilF
VSAPRRNEPCPCGSGRRYKDCHGKLGAGEPGADALVRRALSAHREGRIDEAARAYADILSREPANAIATHYLGLIDWQRGDLARAEERMRASIAADPKVPDFHNNLGLLLRDARRLDEAIDCFRAALAANPAWIEAYSNLALAFEAGGRWNEATAAYREAIAREPRFAAARQNLARALLARGEYREGWLEYRWRLLAQGIESSAPDPGVARLPADLAQREFLLLSEQGVGDVLFFLRFAPELVRRGARLAFRGDARLHSMLERTGLFALGIASEGVEAPGLEAIRIGDLPFLLAIDDPAGAPPSLALAPRAESLLPMRSALEASGPPPYVALTWRAGLASAGPSRTQLKEVDPATLGESLRGITATWIGVQRLPREGELQKLSDAIGAPVHDFSRCNDSLEEMLALLSLADRYAGVSNANTYLRAGLGLAMEVLVAHPPEWRWRTHGSQSPWFAATRVFRQRVDGDWSEALRELRATFT